MMELRVNASNQCYLDGFMKTDLEGLTLIDETRVHPTETWHHAAITYKDSTFTTYFNGVMELSGTCRYLESIVNPTGKTSLGARMNQVAHFSGRMKTLKISHACLEPEQFLSIPDTVHTAIPDFSESGPGSLQFYPNPVDTRLHLRFSPDTEYSGGVIRIYDLGGKTVVEQELQDGVDNRPLINTSGLPAGVYILSLNSGGQIDYRKFVVLH
jgi:hypothetical protein